MTGSLRRAFAATLALFLLAVFVPGAQAGERSPIVFAHGIGVPGQLYETFSPLKKVFASLGYEVYIAHTPVTGSLEERAQVLHDEIVRLVPEGTFHLLGHSMGGLDARLAVARYPDIASRCLSVTTMATPHHGSAVADYVVAHAEDLGQRSSLAHSILELLGGSYEALRQLTTDYLDHEFNARVADQSGIRYFSMGFAIPEPVERHSLVPVLWASHALIAAAGGARNDGLVSVESSSWGRSLGVYAADHWSETAPVPFIGGDSYKDIAARVVANLTATFEADTDQDVFGDLFFVPGR